MALKTVGIIEIPHAANTEFDHGALDAKTRRIGTTEWLRGAHRA